MGETRRKEFMSGVVNYTSMTQVQAKSCPLFCHLRGSRFAISPCVYKETRAFDEGVNGG
jgi:hypothetical protein